MIVLIFDEVQPAITTEAGVATMFALKVACDELNSSQRFGLCVVCSGSHSDKLADAAQQQRSGIRAGKRGVASGTQARPH